MMARKTAQTVTPEPRGEHPDDAAKEIRDLRTEAERKVEALEQVRGLLDVDYLRQLIRDIEHLEERIHEMEHGTFGSRASAALLEDELAREQDRLAKLWDAYKAQEDELQRLRRDYPLMEEKLFDRERHIEKLRREIEELGSLASYKTEYQALLHENERLARDAEQAKKLREENDRLEGKLDHEKAEAERAKRALRELEQELSALQAREPDSRRAEELQALLDEEQDRLAKLYRVYEDAEEERKQLRERLKKWEEWFTRVAPAIEDVAKAPTTAPRSSS